MRQPLRGGHGHPFLPRPPLPSVKKTKIKKNKKIHEVDVEWYLEYIILPKSIYLNVRARVCVFAC